MMTTSPSKQLYVTRCSPECPYPWCQIVTDVPPIQLPQEQLFKADPKKSEKDKNQDGRPPSQPSISKPQSDSKRDQESPQGDREPGESPKNDGRDDGRADSDDSREADKQERDTSDSSESVPEKPAVPSPTPQKVEEITYEPVFKFDSEYHGYGASDSPDLNIAALPQEKVLSDKVFIARLKNIMTDNKYDRRVKGRKRGKLDMRSLYKVPAKVENVFTLKEARKNKQYNVLLLVDESGSMKSNNKSKVAAECAVFLAKSFEGLNVNVAIVGFNTYITTRKEFTGPADYDKIQAKIASMNNRSGWGDNNDWDGLNKSYQMFQKAPPGENLLIMLSDGSPASCEPYFRDIRDKEEKPPKNTGTLNSAKRDSKLHIHHLVKANYKVKSIGIGILEGGWQIPNHQVVHDVQQLKPAIIKELRRHIRRG